MPHVKLRLEVGHDLALLGDPLADEDGPHVRLHQGAVPHVPHPAALIRKSEIHKLARLEPSSNLVITIYT